MNVSVSAELFGKQHKVDVWLMQRTTLDAIKVEVERTLQTEAVLHRPQGYKTSLAVSLGALQVYDVQSYCWTPLTDVSQVSHQSQLFAEVIERGASSSPQQRQHPVRPQKEAPAASSPLQQLPPPKELPHHHPSPGRIGRSLSPRAPPSPRTASPQSPVRSLRFVPPPLSVVVAQRAAAAAAASGTPAPPWQAESCKKSFRGYVVSSPPTSPAPSPSPSPADVCDLYPVGTPVTVEGEHHPLHGQRCVVSTYRSAGRRVDLETPSGSVVAVPSCRLRSYAPQQQQPQQHLHRPVTPVLGPEPGPPPDTPEFFRESLVSQAKVFNAVTAKHDAMLAVEKRQKEDALRRLAGAREGAAEALEVKNTERTMRRGFVRWLGWLAGEHWKPDAPPVSPVSSLGGAKNRRDFDEQLALLREKDAKQLADDKSFFERELKAKTDQLIQKLARVKAELDAKDSEVYQEQLVSASLRFRLKEALKQHSGPPKEPEPPEPESPRPEAPNTPRESAPSLSDVSPSSPLAGEMAAMQRQLAEVRIENEALRRERSLARREEAETTAAAARAEAAEAAAAQLRRLLAAAEKREGDATSRAEAAEARVRELEAFISSRNLDADLPWGIGDRGASEQIKEDDRLTAARKKHKAAVEKARQQAEGSRVPTPTRSRPRQNSPVPRRRSGSVTADGTPVQAHHYPIDSEITFSALSGALVTGWVRRHVHGRVEVQTADGSKHTVLPSRIRPPSAAPAQASSSSSSSSSVAASLPGYPGGPGGAHTPSLSEEPHHPNIVHSSTSGNPGEEEVVLIQMGPPSGFCLQQLENEERQRSSRRSRR